MKDFAIQHPLQDRKVYGTTEDDQKILIGHITCVTPPQWVMYWGDASWRFISLVDDLANSKAGSYSEIEQYVYDLVSEQTVA